MKVWLVWTGEYSDKDVVAVAQTEQIAKKLAEVYSLGKYKPRAYVTEADFATEDNVKFDKGFLVEREVKEPQIVEVQSVEYVNDFDRFDDVFDYGSLEVWVKASDPDEALAKARKLFAEYEAKQNERWST